MIPILMDSNISFHLEIYVHRILQNYLRGLPKHSPRQKQREVQINENMRLVAFYFPKILGPNRQCTPPPFTII